jgi:CheY-like chemotaxis protein
VRADRTQLQQVLLNLAVNARDAMPGGGTLTIRTRLSAGDGADGAALTAGFVVLEVVDTGRGIDPSDVEHIFEPFYTTKAFGQGTGLGLSTVYGIAKQSGGDVRVVSTPGRGSTFQVLLPAAVGAPKPASREPEWPAAMIAATVLLVEDDDGVREFVAEALRATGCDVVLAASPAEALAIAARQSRVIDLLVTDVVMPGMNGGELADRLVAMRPELRVLFMTGYDDEEVAARGLVGPRRDCLTKPFPAVELRARVRALVSGAPRAN